MARLPLVGQFYSSRSLATAAQTCINVYAEPTSDPNEKAKGIGALYGIPGRKIFKDLTTIDAAAHPVRGIWSGGGRLFVAAGTKYMELDSTGALVGSVRTIADDGAHSPVQFIANGTQLFIVSAGLAYIDNGSGPTLISFPGSAYTDLTIGYSGVVDTSVIGIVWVSGDLFNVGMEGEAISVAATIYTVAHVYSEIQLNTTVAVTPGTGLAWFLGTNNVLTSKLQPFGPEDIGATLNITAGTGFTVQSVTILSVDGFGNAICSASLGTIGATGGIATESFPFTALTGAYLDGYYLVNKPGTQKFYWSDLGDGGSWHAIQVGVKESSPDYIRSILVNNEQLFLFGTDTYEVWQDSGGGLINGIAQDPFARINGATGHFGSISAWGPTLLDGRVYFLGGNDQGQICAYVMNGFTPVRISTYAEESAWTNGQTPSNVISYSYLEEGHSFWVFHIGSQCWAFDTTTGAWHQRAAWSGSAFTTYPTYYHTYIAEFGVGKHLTGGMLNGTVYESSVNFYDDAGSDLAWQRALPYEFSGGLRNYFGRMNLEVETGTVASGAAPLITRDYSDDRGNTFVNPQTASLGVHNAFSLRVFWPACGSSYDRVFRFTGVGKEKVALVALDCDVITGVN